MSHMKDKHIARLNKRAAARSRPAPTKSTLYMVYDNSTSSSVVFGTIDYVYEYFNDVMLRRPASLLASVKKMVRRNSDLMLLEVVAKGD